MQTYYSDAHVTGLLTPEELVQAILRRRGDDGVTDKEMAQETGLSILKVRILRRRLEAGCKVVFTGSERWLGADEYDWHPIWKLNKA